jgi:hypothetical protein
MENGLPTGLGKQDQWRGIKPEVPKVGTFELRNGPTNWAVPELCPDLQITFSEKVVAKPKRQSSQAIKRSTAPPQFSRPQYPIVGGESLDRCNYCCTSGHWAPAHHRIIEECKAKHEEHQQQQQSTS